MVEHGGVLGRGRYTHVVSSGSAVALSFPLVARATSIDAHYIESAARVRGVACREPAHPEARSDA